MSARGWRMFRIFLKKELVEAFKTYKLLILGAVYIVLGIVSPLIAKMTPDIVKLAMQVDPTTAGMDLGAFVPEPNAFSAWAQFYGNVSQIGLIALVVVFGGMMASELSKGQITILLTKGLPRGTVILSKLAASAFIWTGCYAAAFFTSWGYTVYFFPGEKLPNLLLAGLCLWAFGMFLLALLALAASLAKESSIICMLSVGAAVVALNILNVAPYVGKYNPATLAGAPVSLVADAVTPRGVYPSLAAAAIVAAALAMLATITFGAKKSKKLRAALALSVAAALSLTIFIGEGAPAQIVLGRHVITEKVTIGAGTEWELPGLLTLPKGAEGKVPAVVLVQGSGSSDKDETIYDNKPFRDIAEYLSTNGIAAIRYDKRTYAYRQKLMELADPSFSVLEETIEDAILAAQVVKSDPRIDEGRVFILGHSLGGMLAPRIHAMGGDFAGLIIFAGSPRFLFDIMEEQHFAVMEVTEDGPKKSDAMEEFNKINNSIRNALDMSDEEVKATIIEGAGASAFYFKDLHDNPTQNYIDEITVPILVMHADADLQVSTERDFMAYKALLDGRPNATFKLYEGLNHLFMPARVSNISELMDDYRVKANVDRQALRDIADWIGAN
ncbi:MAG: alpha/beta fold hydrolase [Oscillospiraceae bacterium]|nr:alpha/beta fold hydrolase [Oscillospiraceae bacterium]